MNSSIKMIINLNIPVNGLCNFGQTRLHWGHVHRSTSRCWQNSGADTGAGSALVIAASLLGRVVVSSLGWFLSIWKFFPFCFDSFQSNWFKLILYLSYVSGLCCYDSVGDYCDYLNQRYPCWLSVVVCVRILCQNLFRHSVHYPRCRKRHSCSVCFPRLSCVCGQHLSVFLLYFFVFHYDRNDVHRKRVLH